MRSILANLIALLHEMTPSHYTNYIDHFKIGEGTGRTDLIDFVMEVFVLFKDLIEQPVFPQVRKSYFFIWVWQARNYCNLYCKPVVSFLTFKEKICGLLKAVTFCRNWAAWLKYTTFKFDMVVYPLNSIVL